MRVSIDWGSRSPKTSTSRSVRPKRMQISWRWVRSMTTMRSAARAASAVTSCDRWTERSTPWRAAAATASGGGGRPGAVKPTESTRSWFRESRRSNAAANGLRQILPRQTTSRDPKWGRRRSALRARCRHSRCTTRRGTRRSRARSSATAHRRNREGLLLDSHETLRTTASHRTTATAVSSIQVS